MRGLIGKLHMAGRLMRGLTGKPPLAGWHMKAKGRIGKLPLAGWHMKGLIGRLPLAGWQRVAAVVGLAILLLAIGTVAAAARAPSDEILAGVRIRGVDVGGMTRAEAVAAVEAEAAKSLHRPIMVLVGKERFRMTPASVGRGAAVDKAVAEALAGPRLSFVGRIWHKVIKRPVTMSVGLDTTRQDQRVEALVSRIAKKMAVAPVDARIELVDGKPVVRHARTGRALDVEAGTKGLLKVLGEAGRKEARLKLSPVAPKVTDEQLGTTIVINKSTNRLKLYKGIKVVKSYGVATGMARYPTPSGTWQVMRKVVNPSWHNPAPDGWGAGMPLVIPPGPGNPLGTRAMALNASGILIHGTYSPWSIGSYASHGCIRLAIPDAEDLYPRVPVGTRVLVHR
jgi:lipoprotein-anchoring transpeptidase ErfK/SrfK